MNNRYFIIERPLENSPIWDYVVQKPDTVRGTTTKTECIIKLPMGDNTNYPELNGLKEYTHQEILEHISKNVEKFSADGSLRVRRGSDFEESDFNKEDILNGNISQWAGGSDVFISKVYNEDVKIIDTAKKQVKIISNGNTI